MSKADRIAPALPTEHTKYRLTGHADRRLREIDRMMNAALVKQVLENGDRLPGKESGTTELVLTVAATEFVVIVDNEINPEWERHDIITMFPRERKEITE